MSRNWCSGANWQRSEGTYTYGSLPEPSAGLPVNVFAWNQASYPDPGEYAYPYSQTAHEGSEQTGVYATLRSEITDKLHTIAGVRYSDYEYILNEQLYSQTTGAATPYNRTYKQSNIWTPYGGLTYDLTKTVSLYASYAQIFSPQGPGRHRRRGAAATYDWKQL